MDVGEDGMVGGQGDQQLEREVASGVRGGCRDSRAEAPGRFGPMRPVSKYQGGMSYLSTEATFPGLSSQWHHGQTWKTIVHFMQMLWLADHEATSLALLDVVKSSWTTNRRPPSLPSGVTDSFRGRPFVLYSRSDPQRIGDLLTASVATGY